MVRLNEDIAALEKKVFEQMSANKARMCRTDLQFPVAEPLPDYAAKEAVERAIAIARREEQNDQLYLG